MPFFGIFTRGPLVFWCQLPSVLRMLEDRGFRNLRGWSHGVDMDLFGYREESQACAHLGARVLREKYRGLFAAGRTRPRCL